MSLVIGYLATPGGADALALGARLASTIGTELDVCIVLPADRPVPALAAIGGRDSVLIDQANQWVADAVASVPEGIVAHGHVTSAPSFAGGLLQEVARLGADLLVVGGSGGGLVGSYSLGTVVNELLHSASVPVAVAPRGMRLSTVAKITGVTCAIGEREGADLLLDSAVRLAKAADVPLRLVSLVAMDPIYGSLRGDQDAVRARATAHAEQTLETAKAELPEGFPVMSTVVDDVTIEAAVGRLEWHDGDLIMVGSSRLSAPKRLFLGSTAAKMLRVLEVPMVVVPRDQLGSDDLP